MDDDDDAFVTNDNHSDADDFQESEPEQRDFGVMSDND